MPHINLDEYGIHLIIVALSLIISALIVRLFK